MTSRRTPGRVWLGYLAAGVADIIGYYLVPAHGPGLPLRVVLYCAASASAAVAVLYGVLRHRPRPALPWLLIGASQVVYAAADASFYIAHYLLDSAAYPSLADLFYLGHYPLLVAGLVLLIRRRSDGRDLPGLLDAAVLAVVAGMLSWLYLISPRASLDAPALATAASLAYPVMDLALLAVAVRLMVGGGRRPASFVLLCGNLVAILTADTLYVFQQLGGSYLTGNFLDAVWLAGNLLLGAAALHPTMALLGEPAPARLPRLGPVRIAALCAATLVAPGVLAVQAMTGEVRDVAVVAGVCGLVSVLTVVRLTGLVADQRRLAITDALTGLHTRRYLEARLPAEVARARRAGGSLAVFIVDVDRFKSINDRYGHPAGDRALTEIAGRLRAGARRGDLLARYGGEEFALLVPGARAGELTAIAERLRCLVSGEPVPLAADGWVAVTVSVGAASYPGHGGCPEELIATADRALYAAKAAGRNHVVVGSRPRAESDDGDVVGYLYRVADAVDRRLSGHEHSVAVSRWGVAVAAELGCGETTLRRVEMAGRLHDIGKIVLPERVLSKPAALTDEEWRLMRQHPDQGARLAAAVPGLADVAEIVRQHHERYDGSGYPARLSGAGIRLEARIVAVCDAWAAMRADRAYQPALPEADAQAQLRAGSGSQFDPAVVDAFLDLYERGLIDTLARTDAEAPVREAS